MKEHFFITGYPRSRTCWAANLLSTQNSFCWHDGLYGLKRLEDIRLRLEQPEVPIVGLSDPAILLFWEHLAQWYPQARWVVILRNVEDSYQSMSEAAGRNMRHDFFLKMEQVLAELLRVLEPLVIPFDSITPQVARQLGSYLGINVGPKERVEQLCATNVQVHDLKGRLEHYSPPQFILNLR